MCFILRRSLAERQLTAGSAQKALKNNLFSPSLANENFFFGELCVRLCGFCGLLSPEGLTAKYAKDFAKSAKASRLRSQECEYLQRDKRFLYTAAGE
jgi:hypothetical protein